MIADALVGLDLPVCIHYTGMIGGDLLLLNAEGDFVCWVFIFLSAFAIDSAT